MLEALQGLQLVPLVYLVTFFYLIDVSLSSVSTVKLQPNSFCHSSMTEDNPRILIIQRSWHHPI